MIGVISKPDDVAAVEEFFQLFKTPWELFRLDASYDVVVITGDEPAELDAKLVLIFGSQARRSDEKNNLKLGARRQNVRLVWNGVHCPLYGEVQTFGAERKAILTTTTSEAAAVEVASENPRVIRLGYDLFAEVAFLLSTGQPLENANIPTLDLHVAIVRDLILKSGVSLIEIPPTPAGYDFAVCLTHDIDFVGIRRHKFDHTMFGFLYRATAGAALNFVRGKSSFSRLMQCWKAAASLPFVHLGLAKDFWMPFEWYLEVEKGLSPTYYIIPFKHRAGDKLNVLHAERRASAYDIGDIPEWVTRLQAEGCEVGVHGIDAWHSVEKGREELKRVAQVSKPAGQWNSGRANIFKHAGLETCDTAVLEDCATTHGGTESMGIRMHWLCRDEKTCGVLEQAGYSYDSTSGYNEAPGYLNGTSQVFLPPGAKTLLELPMHIQDGALFFPGRLGLTDAEATKLCDGFITNAKMTGGVLTFIWHDRSHAAERFWGEFYIGLVNKLKAGRTWFAQARQVVGWFRQRREVSFQRCEGGIKVCGTGGKAIREMTIRIHRAGEVVEMAWDGERDLELAEAGQAREVCAAS